MKKSKNPLAADSQDEVGMDFILKNKHLSYLNLDWAEIQKLTNSPTPLDNRSNQPDLDLIKIIRNPKYFHFTCKYVLNKDIHPFQSLILQQLWGVPFPMLIGSRGLSKCVTKDTLILTDKGIKKIGELIPDDFPEKERKYISGLKVLGENGFNEIEYAWNNGFSETYKITTETGLTLEMNADHPIRVRRSAWEKQYEWVEAKDLQVGDNTVIDRSGQWIKDRDSNGLRADFSYLLGLLTNSADFNYKNYIVYNTNERKIADVLIETTKKYFGRPFKKVPNLNRYKVHDEELIERLFTEFGFGSTVPEERDIPACILKAPKKSVWAFIKGVFRANSKYIKLNNYDANASIHFFSKSEKLVKSLQFVLFRLGVVSSVVYRKVYFKPHVLIIYANSIALFNKNVKLGFRSRSKQSYTELDKRPFIDVITKIEKSYNQTFDLHLKEDHSFITNGFISHNSFSLALYIILYSLIHPGRKTAITGAVFRQSKVVFEYIDQIWKNAPVLRDLLGNSGEDGAKHAVDQWSFRLGDSLISAYPIGTGDKIRGQRANLLVIDEFSSLNPEIYETVISGFAAVSSNPIENIKKQAEINTLKKLGVWTPAHEKNLEENKQGNQTILAGTAYYSFNHFYTYWKRYKEIIESKGDKGKLEEIFKGEVFPGFDHKNYSIIRIPIELVPEGFMDAAQIARSKSTVHNAIFLMEFGTVWATDSDGFFKRSLIESCVCSENNKIFKPSGPVKFRATTKGNRLGRYVYGIDPASEKDNFSIVVLELHEDHNRIVYCWTCTREIHRQVLKNKGTAEEDFYGFCVRKIRSLMKVFPCELIALDSQGGGVAILEDLHDSKNLLEGEQLIWPIAADHPLSDGKERDFDHEPGLHIVEVVNFAKAEYVSEANHGLRRDMEYQELIFPMFDALEISLATENDNLEKRVYDTLEDCVLEIEELKNELSTIEHSQTGIAGRDHWDTPEIKKSGNKKGRMRKDRYSALLMANMAARRLGRAVVSPTYKPVGGFVGKIEKSDNKQLYTGPAWFTQGAGQYNYYGTAIGRGNRN